MWIHTEPWIFVYLTLVFGCETRVLEPLFVYFSSMKSTGERLIKAATDFMHRLGIPRIDPPEGGWYSHCWKEPGPDVVRSPLFIGIWGPDDTGLTVTRVGYAYLQMEGHTNPVEELRFITRRPTPEGFHEKRRVYPSFARWFAEFENRFKELASWNRGERPGPNNVSTLQRYA